MIDYSKYTTTPAVPEASSMIETFRAIGYSIEAAVADIIDNSISAGAKNIWVNFEWQGAATWLSVKDDGSGMNKRFGKIWSWFKNSIIFSMQKAFSYQ
jgi:light-regulated signal transduction histidine kinase (bacteriophytochrome)